MINTHFYFHGKGQNADGKDVNNAPITEEGTPPADATNKLSPKNRGMAPNKHIINHAPFKLLGSGSKPVLRKITDNSYSPNGPTG